MPEEHQIALGIYRLEKAKERLKPAETLLAAGSFDDSIGRSYYINLLSENEIYPLTDEFSLTGSKCPHQGFKLFILGFEEINLDSDHEEPPKTYINIHILYLHINYFAFAVLVDGGGPEQAPGGSFFLEGSCRKGSINN